MSVAAYPQADAEVCSPNLRSACREEAPVRLPPRVVAEDIHAVAEDARYRAGALEDLLNEAGKRRARTWQELQSALTHGRGERRDRAARGGARDDQRAGVRPRGPITLAMTPGTLTER